MLSDHCPISAIIHFDFSHNNQQPMPTKMNQLEKRYIWNSNDDQTFSEVLSSPVFADVVQGLSHKQICPIQLKQEIRDLKRLKMAKQNSQKYQNKPWFDKNCQELKNQIKKKGKLLNRNPGDMNTREQIYILKKKMRNSIKT